MTKIRPRLSLLLLGSTMAACATTSPQPLGGTPAAGFAEPSAPRQDGGWPHPRGMFSLRGAVGESSVQSVGFPENQTDSALIRLGFEGGGETFGGGVKLEFSGTDGDLLEDSGAVDTDLSTFDLFPFFMIRPTAERFRIPIRIGPYVQVHSITGESGSLENLSLPENSSSDESLDWFGIGLRLEIEPEFDIVRSDGLAFSAYGQISIGGAAAGLSADIEDDDNDYDTSSESFGFETGLRFQAAKFLLEGGYVIRRTTYDETDPEFNAAVRSDVVFLETDFEFSGLFLALGVRW